MRSIKQITKKNASDFCVDDKKNGFRRQNQNQRSKGSLPFPAAAPPEPPPREATLSRRPVTASNRATNFSKSAAILFRDPK